MKRTLIAGFLFWAVVGVIGFWFDNRNHASGKVLGVNIVTVAFADEPPSILPPETYYGSPVLTTVTDILRSRGVTVFPEDEVRAFPDPSLGLGSTVKVYRATPLTVVDAGRRMQYRTFQKVVRDFLDDQHIDLADRDKVTPSLDTTLTADMKIEIVRVTVGQETTTEPIDFKSITKEDANLNKGIRNVTQAGKKGKRKKTFEVTRENGKEVSRTKIKEEVVDQPVDEIVVVGTKEVVLGQGTATWYTFPPHAPGTAAHNSLPRGTQVRVTSLSSGKSVVVKVIGGGIQGAGVIDLHPDDFKQLAPLGAGVITVKLTQE